MSTTSGISREPSTYSPSSTLLQKLNDNPIPPAMIGECVRDGDVKSRNPNNPFQVTLRLEGEVHHIELLVDLEANEVFDLRSSYET